MVVSQGVPIFRVFMVTFLFSEKRHFLHAMGLKEYFKQTAQIYKPVFKFQNDSTNWNLNS